MLTILGIGIGGLVASQLLFLVKLRAAIVVGMALTWGLVLGLAGRGQPQWLEVLMVIGGLSAGWMLGDGMFLKEAS